MPLRRGATAASSTTPGEVLCGPGHFLGFRVLGLNPKTLKLSDRFRHSESLGWEYIRSCAIPFMAGLLPSRELELSTLFSPSR